MAKYMSLILKRPTVQAEESEFLVSCLPIHDWSHTRQYLDNLGKHLKEYYLRDGITYELRESDYQL